ncbi:ferritin-like domain-containing protein [Amycolatopsis eburnea]|uniref:Ferritin-like domain-containing protein n=1 Tax=Amycolatopsis eburnea TaxID=2267691 RepID=A0A427TH78_9PSEU|nr:ferritin-like domain-containing protein [Amycolatopsis eburnea]RSD22795.1 ferritin-like domain-containing protein [Amycolatopsis eburnea]
MTYAQWLQDFETEAERRRQRDDPPWSRGASLDPAIARSVQRFQVGEAGDGANLIAKAAGDDVYLAAVKLFVAEEQNHARMLAELLGAAGVPTIGTHWSDTVFVRLRRALGLRLELMVLLIAEVVALRYYRALRGGTADPLVTQVAARILADEERHVPFHCHRLRIGFARFPEPVRAAVFGAWRVLLIGVAVTVAADHGPALHRLGVGRLVFVADVLTAFESALARIRGEEPKPKPRYRPKRARPRGLV